MKITNKMFAECLGTFWLVLGGCGTALFGHVGFLGVALAFGLTVVAMAYGVGHISGAHLNPAVSFGVWVGGRMSLKDMLLYWVAQCVGAIIAGAALAAIYGVETGIGTNGIGAGCNGCWCIALAVEVILTALFVLVVLGATHKTNGATGNFAGLAIGLSLVLVHLVCIRYTGTSVNPARSLAPAFFQGGTALANLWIFIVGPFVGGALAACIWKLIEPAEK